LKSEKSEKSNKREYSVRTIHKNSICRVLFLTSIHREGMTEKEIHKRLNYLTPKTVFNLLNELISEKKVFKSKTRYYLDLFIEDGWLIFAEYLNEFQRQSLLNRISLLKLYSNENVFHDELENAILNFGKVVGAFVTYILIESLRPNERMVPIFERKQMFDSFLQRAFNLQFIMPSLLRILPGNADRMAMGTDNESFEKIINAYDRIYTNFRESLDGSFKKYIHFDMNKSCDHEWRKIDIHKIGKRFECVKCLGLAEEKDLES
jgi:hypothetical protein